MYKSSNIPLLNNVLQIVPESLLLLYSHFNQFIYVKYVVKLKYYQNRTNKS